MFYFEAPETKLGRVTYQPQLQGKNQDRKYVKCKVRISQQMQKYRQNGNMMDYMNPHSVNSVSNHCLKEKTNLGTVFHLKWVLGVFAELMLRLQHIT